MNHLVFKDPEAPVCFASADLGLNNRALLFGGGVYIGARDLWKRPNGLSIGP